ncbi:hypothetical protein A2867_02875 [Candidatus Daviesbacteria bacterium RIFCSPHIGHO2_01_FULL_40_11]|uniref:Uncharacterized protein n=1 Tax=Candidatus Daviesbacteria bacterium RIFCSPHIGHO2_01_FULL_40_11 TaxID=1797762 RepID=A0A1F5JJN0_9BACT|nr:MAG: hypothetical protein A2867_02875 [Candidatus Daviesbacteria bacterium RIFCSPHIGHO2_01_FULL_40_11]
MAKIVDPDSLSLIIDGSPTTEEVSINTTTKKVQLLVAGNLNDTAPGSTSGVTLQAVYSFLKEEWKTQATLNKFKFPIKMFTKTDGQFQNGWDWEDAQTRQLVRDAGWTETNGDKYAGLITLGNFDATGDQGYYLQTSGFAGTKSDFDKTGNVNEAVMIYNSVGPVDSTGYLKAFLRIQAKLYSEYNLLSEQGISALEPVLYRLPLSNSTDLKTTDSDATIDGANPPYNGMKINYLKGSRFSTWANSTVYAAGAVVQEATGSPKRWFFTPAGGTSSGTDVQDDTGVTDWEAYDGEESINGVYYAFNRVITCNNATDRQVYDWAMRQLRKTTDINADDTASVNQRGFGNVKGNIGVPLVEYVGDTLKPKGGVLLRGFASASTNNIIHRDITVGTGASYGLNAEFVPNTSTERPFPTVASGTLEFSANLVSEADANTKYTMYFTTNPAGNFDTANAIIVDNNSAADITGQITAASIAWDFDYTNNAQGGRTPATDAAVTVVAQGLPGAEWTSSTFTITATSGQTITVTANDERNYSNPT